MIRPDRIFDWQNELRVAFSLVKKLLPSQSFNNKKDAVVESRSNTQKTLFRLFIFLYLKDISTECET